MRQLVTRGDATAEGAAQALPLLGLRAEAHLVNHDGARRVPVDNVHDAVPHAGAGHKAANLCRPPTRIGERREPSPSAITPRTPPAGGRQRPPGRSATSRHAAVVRRDHATIVRTRLGRDVVKRNPFLRRDRYLLVQHLTWAGSAASGSACVATGMHGPCWRSLAAAARDSCVHVSSRTRYERRPRGLRAFAVVVAAPFRGGAPRRAARATGRPKRAAACAAGVALPARHNAAVMQVLVALLVHVTRVRGRRGCAAPVAVRARARRQCAQRDDGQRRDGGPGHTARTPRPARPPSQCRTYPLGQRWRRRRPTSGCGASCHLTRRRKRRACAGFMWAACARTSPTATCRCGRGAGRSNRTGGGCRAQPPPPLRHVRRRSLTSSVAYQTCGWRAR